MLVVDQGPGLRLIPQVDHAALSGDIALGWRAPRSIPEGYWPLFLEAVRHHDDGWAPADAAPALRDGRPLDFKETPIRRHVEVWRRSMDCAGARHPYLEIVVGNHGRWLFTRFPRTQTAEERAVVAGFLAEAGRRVDGRIAELRGRGGEARAVVEADAIEAARRLLSFFDALSLALLGGLPFFGSTEPLAFGDEESVLSLKKGGRAAAAGTDAPPVAAAGGASISPWSFRTARIAVSAAALDLPVKTFGSTEECASAMGRTRPTTLPFVLESRE